MSRLDPIHMSSFGPLISKMGPIWIPQKNTRKLYMGFCQEYWQFLIVIGILGGTGTSFIFIVPVASIGPMRMNVNTSRLDPIHMSSFGPLISKMGPIWIPQKNE
jgi:hypothetical protein